MCLRKREREREKNCWEHELKDRNGLSKKQVKIAVTASYRRPFLERKLSKIFSTEVLHDWHKGSCGSFGYVLEI